MSEIDNVRSKLKDWTVDPLGGPQIGFLNIESFQPVRKPKEGRAMVRRWRAMGPYVDDHIANLRRGAAAGRVAVRVCVDKVIDELRDLAGKPDSEWPLLKPLAVPHKDWTEAARRDFREGLEAAVRDSVRPRSCGTSPSLRGTCSHALGPRIGRALRICRAGRKPIVA